MTVRTSKYRAWTVLPAVGLAVAAALVVPNGAGAAAPPEDGSDAWIRTSPVGKWEGTVEHAEGTGRVTLSFHRNGVMCLSSGGGAEGGGEGRGSWQRTGTSQFTYRVRERLYGGDGTTTGYVDVDQRAVQRALAFSSTGISKIYDAGGNYLLSAESTVKVKRVSATPASC